MTHVPNHEAEPDPEPSRATDDAAGADGGHDGNGDASPAGLDPRWPTAGDSDRVALAKAVGGTLAGPADAVRAGGYYLQVPNADLDPTVADRVIRYPTVQEVGPVSCPSRCTSSGRRTRRSRSRPPPTSRARSCRS